MKLLVIRPQPGADATVARIESQGHAAISMPLFEVQAVAWDVPSPDSYDAVMVTSGNAVRLAGDLERFSALPLYAVGSATAQTAREAGLSVTIEGKAGAEALLDTAKQSGHRRLLWLAGEDRTALTIPDRIAVDTRVVYASIAQPTPACFAVNVDAADAVLLHSARAAVQFQQECYALHIVRARITLAALAPAIAENAGSGWKRIVVAPQPTDASLLSELQSCFTNPDCDP